MRSVRKNEAMEFDISYTSKEITPWGVMVILKQMLQKIGFREQIANCKTLHSALRSLPTSPRTQSK
jgi:hypothetical protein